MAGGELGESEMRGSSRGERGVLLQWEIES